MKRAIFCAVMLLALPGIARAEDDMAITLTRPELQIKKRQDADLHRQLNKGEEELQELRRKLVQAAAEEDNSEEMLLSLHAKMNTLQKKEAAQKEALIKQQQRIRAILAGLLRLARTPGEMLLAVPGRTTDTIRSAILLNATLPHYTREAERLGAQLAALERTRSDILTRQQELDSAQKNFAQKEKELNVLLAERENWLRATEDQRVDLRRQIAALSAEAQNVQDLIQKLTFTSFRMQDKHRKTSGLHFITPARGRIVYGYGDKDDVGSPSKGITLRVHSAEMIVAPADGQVVFAGPFRGYGNILILRHGDDYHSFLAGFGRLDVAVGQVVNAGEPLGRANGESSSAQFYYELRHSGSPVDPSELIRAVNVATLN